MLLAVEILARELAARETTANLVAHKGTMTPATWRGCFCHSPDRQDKCFIQNGRLDGGYIWRTNAFYIGRISHGISGIILEWCIGRSRRQIRYASASLNLFSFPPRTAKWNGEIVDTPNKTVLHDSRDTRRTCWHFALCTSDARYPFNAATLFPSIIVPHLICAKLLGEK